MKFETLLDAIQTAIEDYPVSYQNRLRGDPKELYILLHSKVIPEGKKVFKTFPSYQELSRHLQLQYGSAITTVFDEDTNDCLYRLIKKYCTEGKHW